MPADLTAVQIATLTGLNRNTVNRFLPCLRERFAQASELERSFEGTIKVDESYFGPGRVRQFIYRIPRYPASPRWVVLVQNKPLGSCEGSIVRVPIDL